jgi:hypothetical protein
MAVGSFETSINFHHTTRRHITQDSNLQTGLQEYLRIFVTYEYYSLTELDIWAFFKGLKYEFKKILRITGFLDFVHHPVF